MLHSPREALLHYRRTVADLYAAIRRGQNDPIATCTHFRRAKDRLFATHPQSPLDTVQKAMFTGLEYYDYDPRWRFVLPVDSNVEPTRIELPAGSDGTVILERFGQVHLPIDGQTYPLSLFWIVGYGGGVYVAFRDATNGHETYGGGRYLLDTIKHADLGQEGDGLILDFNYSYYPSCAYNERWVCPLPPRENWLPIPIPAGERGQVTTAS